MDALAVSYATEVLRFDVDSAIVVPGAFTSGTNHFLQAGAPADTDRAAAYDERYGALPTGPDKRLAAPIPPDADTAQVADRIRADFFRRVGLDDLLTAGSSL
ncbi:hypothetical protein ABT032_04030 [Streptomyces flaveus]